MPDTQCTLYHHGPTLVRKHVVTPYTCCNYSNNSRGDFFSHLKWAIIQEGFGVGGGGGGRGMAGGGD